MEIQLKRLRLDGDTQPRGRLDDAAVSKLVSDLRSGDLLPAVTVFFDGESYWLSDGFHRVEAFRLLGKEMIAAHILSGGPRQAYLHALRSNEGLPLSLSDKKRAAERLLADGEWSKLPDREIGRRCGISHPAVSEIRRLLSGKSDQMPTERTDKEKQPPAVEPPKEKTSMGDVVPIRAALPVTTSEDPPAKRKVTRNGKTYEMKTAGIGASGKKNKGKPPRLNLKAWEMVKGLPLAKDRNQVRQLERLSSKEQTAVARLLSDGSASTVSEAVEAMRGGAPADAWSVAYQAVMRLRPEDRLRLCRMVTKETEAEKAS